MKESYLSWNPAQVAQYFSKELNADLRTSFLDHDIDGSLLPFLTTGHLRELGIESLALRLRVKRKINDLLASSFTSGTPKTLGDSDVRLNSIDINSNYVSMEALSLCVRLLRDMSGTTRQASDESTDIKKLSDSIRKLKTSSNPVSRIPKVSKPLPTPTLDPGAYVSSPTHTVNSFLSTISSDSENGQTPTSSTTLVLPSSSPNPSGISPYSPGSVSSASSPGKYSGGLSSGGLSSGGLSSGGLSSGGLSSGGLSSGGKFSPVYLQQSSGDPSISSTSGSISNPKADTGTSLGTKNTVSSPTQSYRFSSGSVLSVGVGKLADLKAEKSRFSPKARLVDAKSPFGSMEDLQEEPNCKTLSRQTSTLSSRTIASKSKSSITSVSAGGQSSQATPLKQLKASSEDTCLKVLQHAMKRHRIPQEKWSKYVLVVCYGDKERILQLTEKPVVIFKELQERGKNPAIMLRERASTSENEYDSEDYRVGDDIPGGTL